VLVVHGAEDNLLPFEAAVDFYSRLEGPKRLWLIPGAGHAQEPVMSHREEYAAQLAGFLDQAMAGQAAPAPALRVGNAELPGNRRALEFTLAGEEARSQAGAASVLVTALGDGTLWQGILRRGGTIRVELPGPVELTVALEVKSLGGDGFPRADDDPPSSLYRSAGYREAFRRLVRAINRRDLPALDAGLDDCLALPRVYPFDFFAATYCLRAALAGRGLVPGWPVPERGIIRRSLERFAALWKAHAFLPGAEAPSSPLGWVEQEMERWG
jgi:hypothetical protein